MLTLTNIGVRFGGQVLYEDLNWQVHPRGHYGLVGANGSGKSTLLRVMSGELTPDAGSVSRIQGLRAGTLGQDHFRFDARSVLDVVLMGQPELWRALEERRQLLAQPDAGPRGGERLAELEVEIAGLDGYQAEARAAALLVGLGIEHERHWRAMHELSGGFRLRVLLAQTLFAAPDLLLLDEPTNHLDIASIRWLEGYLRDFAGAFVMISHDRHFLNAVCDTIADIDYQELRLYTGNYDAFEQAKALAVTQRDAEIARTEARIEEMQAFIDRFRAKATKARQASARKKQVEKMELPEIKRSSRRAPALRFEQRRPSGKEVLHVLDVSKAYGETQVLRDVSFTLNRGEKLAVIGPNGIGKSTLLNVIAGRIHADHGIASAGYEVHLGYFAQNHHELLDGTASAYEWLCSATGIADIPTIRGMLGRVLLSGDDAAKRVTDLSGGESARLLLAALMLQKPNLLVLDEPTNHLDLEGREALMRALQEYTGTVLFVSHDRHFVSSVGTRVLALTREGVDDFAGNYEDYLRREGEDYLTVEGSKRGNNGRTPVPAPLSSSPIANSPISSGEEYAQRKDRRRNLALLKRTVERLERETAEMEQELAQLELAFSDSSYYQRASREQIDADAKRRELLQEQLTQTVEAWEAAATELDGLVVEGA